MQGGYGPTGGDGMAIARRLGDEVRVELRHAAHGCPMAVEADLTCEQPSILVTEMEKKEKNTTYSAVQQKSETCRARFKGPADLPWRQA